VEDVDRNGWRQMEADHRPITTNPGSGPEPQRVGNLQLELLHADIHLPCPTKGLDRKAPRICIEQPLHGSRKYNPNLRTLPEEFDSRIKYALSPVLAQCKE